MKHVDSSLKFDRVNRPIRVCAMVLDDLNPRKFKLSHYFTTPGSIRFIGNLAATLNTISSTLWHSLKIPYCNGALEHSIESL
jgi:hypothetical protein